MGRDHVFSSLILSSSKRQSNGRQGACRVVCEKRWQIYLPLARPQGHTRTYQYDADANTTAGGRHGDGQSVPAWCASNAVLAESSTEQVHL